MDETADLLTEVRDLQRRLLEAQEEPSDLNVRGLKILMIFLFPLTSVVLLYVAVSAVQMASRGADERAQVRGGQQVRSWSTRGSASRSEERRAFERVSSLADRHSALQSKLRPLIGSSGT